MADLVVMHESDPLRRNVQGPGSTLGNTSLAKRQATFTSREDVRSACTKRLIGAKFKGKYNFFSFIQNVT